MIRVLYAEDDPQVAEMVQLYFGRFADSYRLEHVDCGRRCLQAMERGGYDVLMLDLQMPDLNGLQVLGELTARRDPTPVVMVSGQGQHELAVRALRAGAVDCIDKNSPDFRRIPEIVQRVHARNKRRQFGVVGAPAPQHHRVLFVDPEETERLSVSDFFRTNAPRLQLTAAEPDTLERFLRGDLEFDAVVLGPNVETIAMFDALRHLRARDEDLPVIVVSAFQHAETTVAAFQLGAHDFLLRGAGTLTELVFSLNNALKRADTERLNA